MTAPALPGLSVTIVARNEEVTLAMALDSVRWADEIIVVDGESTDRTAEIARRYTDRVIVRPWPGFAAQKNFAISQAHHEWVLSLDADEVVPPSLAGEIRAVVRGERPEVCFRFPRQTNFCGRFLRHGGNYPDYAVRLFRRDSGAFNDENVHDIFLCEGPTGELRNDLLHFSHPTIEVCLRKFQRNAELGAANLMQRGKPVQLWHLTAKPFWKFLKAYVLRGGFLDGRHGLVYAVLGAWSVFLRYARLWEMTQTPALPQPLTTDTRAPSLTRAGEEAS
jgi:glycosyltransferase involved in cell wall biosynthesis